MKPNRKDIIKYVQEHYSVEAEYLWEGETHAVFRQPQTQKWFAIIMDVKKSHLHLDNAGKDETIDIMNVKADPIVIEDLLHEEGFLPAYHMSKKYWVSIRLDGTVTGDAIKRLLEESYQAVSPKRGKIADEKFNRT